MRRRGIGYLLSLFALLWARLPGPSAQREEGFECRLEPDGVKIVSLKKPWLESRTTGITLQRLRRTPDGYVAEEEPLKSLVEVENVSTRIAIMRNLREDLKGRLLKGEGLHALVTGSVQGEEFIKLEDMLIEGDGRGRWKIIERG